MFRQKKHRLNTFSIMMFLISVIFYLGFAFWDSVYLSPDSETYITMSLHREPLYPLFLAFFRFCFGPDKEIWLQWAVAAQSVLTAAAAWSIPSFLYKRLRLPKIQALVLLCFPLAVSLLCRYGAGRRAMYSNSIESEAIALPLFLLFIRYLAEFIMNRWKSQDSWLSCYRDKSLWLSGLLCFLLISSRKQMLCTLFIFGFLLIAAGLRSKKPAQGFLCLFLSAALILSLTAVLDRSYNYLLRGENMSHSGDSRFLLTMVCYTADREDAERIADPQIRELFLDIYDTCDSAGYLKNSAGKGWLNRVTHFGDHYDHIQVDTLRPTVAEFVAKQYPGSESRRASKSDMIMRTMTGSLLPVCLPSIIGCFIDNVLSGLVTTVALRTPVLVAFSILLYAGYILLLIYLIRQKRRKEVVLFSFLTLVSVFINVGLVSAVIFCQSRYTIYNMPLFYMSFFLMLTEATGSLRERGKLPLHKAAK